MGATAVQETRLHNTHVIAHTHPQSESASTMFACGWNALLTVLAISIVTEYVRILMYCGYISYC